MNRISRKYRISIHALREEGDHVGVISEPALFDFYPRPPRGGRPGIFQGVSHLVQISIHALREEGDLVAFFNRGRQSNFYPRPPRGGRQASARS